MTHDPSHQSWGTKDASGVDREPVDQLEAQEDVQGHSCDPCNTAGVRAEAPVSQDQEALKTQVTKDIENQHIHDFGSLMLTRSQKTRLVMRKLEETRSYFDPG